MSRQRPAEVLWPITDSLDPFRDDMVWMQVSHYRTAEWFRAQPHININRFNVFTSTFWMIKSASIHSQPWCHLIPWKWAEMLKGLVNTSVIKERHSTWIIREKVQDRMCVWLWVYTSVHVVLWEAICVCWSVYAFPRVCAWTRLVISDKGHGEWQGGQPAGVCQWSGGVNSGLSDRDFSWHSGHSCFWKSNYKVAGCNNTMKTVAMKTLTAGLYSRWFVPWHEW